MIRLQEEYKEYNGKLIPKEWEGYKIGDIVKFEGGAQPPKSEFKFVYEKGYIRLIQIRDYKNDEYITFIPEKLARKFCDETDIMIGRYGPPIFQILRGIKGAYNVALMKAIPDESKVVKEYIYYYLQIESLFKLIDKLSRRSSGQTGVDLDALNNFDIPLPSIEEQKKIVDLIKDAEELIRKQQQFIEKKKEFKKGLMQRLLNGEVRFKEFKDKWNNKALENYITPIIRECDKPSEGYWRLGLRSHGKGTFHEFVEDPSTVSMDKLYKVKCNDLIVNITFAWEHAIAVANSMDEDKLVSHRFPTYEFKDNAYPLFFKYYILQSKFRHMLVNISPGGAGRNRVMSKKDFLNLIVKVPSYNEQVRIAEVLTEADKEIELLQKELEALKLQKKGLMQMLLTGEVRVNL
ncbi:MAG: restriction endonuclease subunit S [Clostridium sp.]|uniref:restriction endonuclease subunit S n=1 Tax=Clostridium sp. TaxID=1506 RepID=UPI002FC75227